MKAWPDIKKCTLQIFNCIMSYISLKPATCRPCVPTLGDYGTVPAITCDCSPVAELLMRRRYFDLCVTAYSRTMFTFENNVSCSSRDCSTTVEPLTNDHPHQRPSLSYDHISCDGQWFLFVYESLTSDHPSYTTTPM